MTESFATCDGCSKKYRVPSAERTYGCKSCAGTVRPMVAVEAEPTAQAAPAKAASQPSPRPSRQRETTGGPGFFGKLMASLAFWKREEETDAVSGSTTLDSMDWDVFGAEPLEDSTELMKQPSLNRGSEDAGFSHFDEAPAAPTAGAPLSDPWREGATAPRVPASDDFSPQGSPDSVRSAFNDFDWD